MNLLPIMKPSEHLSRALVQKREGQCEQFVRAWFCAQLRPGETEIRRNGRILVFKREC